MVNYITLFYDIGRADWNSVFKRSFEEYLGNFLPFIQLFHEQNEDTLYVFIDKKHVEKLSVECKNKNNIKLVHIDEKWMQRLPMWKTLDKEREIMNSDLFCDIIPSGRKDKPETFIPEYTLINHCKIDVICWAIDNLPVSDYYCWVDFGFFSKLSNIPQKLLDVKYFDEDKISYALINTLENVDIDPFFTLIIAPEKIAGYFFFGSQNAMKQYQKLYHSVLDRYQNQLKIADDDQALALACYFTEPELFKLFYLPVWHSALVALQKK